MKQAFDQRAGAEHGVAWHEVTINRSGFAFGMAAYMRACIALHTSGSLQQT